MCGELYVVVIEMSSLQKYTADAQIDMAKLSDYMAGIEGFTEEKIDDLKEKGVVFLQHVLQKDKLLHVPMGWLLLERAPKSQTLIYGVRKSFFTASDKAKAAYAHVLGMFRQDGRNTERMDKIYDKIQECLGAAPA